MAPVLLAIFGIAFFGVCVWFRLKPQIKFNWLPVGGFLVVLVGSVFGRDFFAIEGGPIPITLDRVLLAGLLGLMAWRMLGREESIRRFNLVDVVAMLWVSFLIWSTITHDWKYLQNMPLARLLFFNLMPLALYFLVRNARLTVKDLKWISIMMGVLGVYLAFTALAEVRDFSAVVFPKYIMTSETTEFLGRGRGPFLNPVSNGIFMTGGFCCLLMWWPRVNRSRQVLVMGVALLLALGVYSTLTRSIWLSFIIACGLFIWLPSDRQLKGAMIIAATLVGILAFPVIGDKIFSFKRDKEVSVGDMEISAQMRPMFAIVAWNMFKDRPILGVGFGQYGQTKHPYLTDPRSGKPLSITKTLTQHNVFLAYLTEMGLVGVCCLSMLLLVMAKVSWDTWSATGLDLWARQFGLLACVLLACYSVNGMFHDVAIIPQNHMLLFFMVGLANNIYSDKASFVVAVADQPAVEATANRGVERKLPGPFQTPLYS